MSAPAQPPVPPADDNDLEAQADHIEAVERYVHQLLTPQELQARRQAILARVRADHPYSDPGDGRSECDCCGKWIWPVTHSCKGVPVTEAARRRRAAARAAQR